MADLKPRQYKRVGRIAENNPERAVRVANRMEKRATREDRGRAIVKSTKRGEGTLRGRNIERGEATMRPNTASARGNTAQQYRASSGRDTPLSATPEPKPISPFTRQ